MDELLYAFSESMNEVSRYLEYLYREKKWDTAQNYSSIETMASLVGKKRNRKKSNVVAMVISPYKNLFDLGVRFSDLSSIGDSRSVLDGSIEIKKGSFFKYSGKNYYLVTDLNFSLREKYIFGYFIEGTKKEVVLGKSDGTPNQSFVINTDRVEANSLSFTKDFNYVVAYRESEGESNGHFFYEDTINTLTSNLFTIDVKDGMTTISFSDGIIGHIPEAGRILKFYYLDTSGSGGNLNARYLMTEANVLYKPNGEIITFIPQENENESTIESFEIDSLYDESDSPLYVQNDATFLNGTDFEEFEDFKNNSVATARARPDKIFSETDLKTFICNSPESEISKISILDTRYNDFSILYSALNYKYDKFSKDESKQVSKFLNSTSEEHLISSPMFVYQDPKIIRLAVKIDLETEESDTKLNDLKEKVKYTILQKYSCLAQEFGSDISLSNIFNIIKDNSSAIELDKIEITFYEKLPLTQKAITSPIGLLLSKDSILKGVFFTTPDDYFYIPYDYDKSTRQAFTITSSDMLAKNPTILSAKKVNIEYAYDKDIIKYVEYSNYFTSLDNLANLSDKKSFFIYIDEVII